MAADEGLVEWVEEAMAPLGTITRQRLFGGLALRLGGVLFAFVGDVLWFKADAETAADWDAIGADHFTVDRAGGKTITIGYRRAPDDCYDDAEALRHWAGLALAAGARAPAPRPKPKRRPAG